MALNIGNYIWAVVPGMTEELWKRIEQEAVNKGIFPKGGYMSIREQIKEEGRQEGWQKGHQKGHQEGQQKGLHEGQQKGRQEGMLQGMQAGLQTGRQEEKRQVILNMLKNDLDMSLICKVTGLSPEEIKKLQNGGI